MSFPSSPTNGQIAIINGITYTYSVAKSAWIRGTTFFVANTLSVAGDVTVVGNLSFGSNTANASFDASTVTSGIILPTGNSLQRPPNPLLGTMRFNSTYNALEVYTASGWTVMSPGTNPTVSNVQFTTNGVVNANVTAFSSTPQQILITGSGFLPPMTVLINGTSVFNTILNSTQILATITGSFNYGNLSVIVSPPLSATGAPAPIWISANVANILVFETPSINLSSNVVLGPGDTATYTLTGGTLPTGTVLLPTGIISGHTTGYSANTAVPITVTATNSENQYSSQNIGLYVIVPTLTISPTTIGSTIQLSAITPVNLIVSGGVAPYTFSANAMPAGLTLSSTGTISGAPLNSGAYAFIVTATDAYGYTTSQTFSGSNAPATSTVNYLAVAGGGGGGAGNYNNGNGGGGAGGLLQGTLTINTGTTTTITVGSGGTVQYNGQNSTIRYNGTNLITAIGGGAGGPNAITSAGQPGGSGGGSLGNGGGASYGLGTAGQGNRGGSGDGIPAGGNTSGGGGGGAGAVGGDGAFYGGGGGNGGAGLAVTIAGNTNYYAGGGGGGNGSTPPYGQGGIGGGGNQSSNGTTNTGGGAGCNDNGGSGIIIVYYLGPQQGIGGAYSFVNGYSIHTFLASGTYNT